jgi:hypothetical protein
MQMHGPALTLDEKLDALRVCDHFRKWSSLDDKRVCILCEKQITGRQIEVVRMRGGKYKANCPTEHCQSSPREWVYPGNPLISEASWHDWELVFEDPPIAEHASAGARRD